MTILESKIVFPSSLDTFFSEPGYSEPIFFESRRSTRLRIRCKATMSIEESLPCVVRAEREAIVFVKDISKRGIGIVSHTQLFPEEKLVICFQQREISATVVRCRRLGEWCWESGGSITSFKNFEDDA